MCFFLFSQGQLVWYNQMKAVLTEIKVPVHSIEKNVQFLAIPGMCAHIMHASHLTRLFILFGWLFVFKVITFPKYYRVT